MTMARAHLVNVGVTRWYRCITRCVRRVFLLGECEGNLDRKQWIEQRLQELSEIFAVSVGGFSVMDNHLHVLVRVKAKPRSRPNWRGFSSDSAAAPTAGKPVSRNSRPRGCSADFSPARERGFEKPPSP